MNSLFRDYETIIASGLFDASYYLEAYPDVAQRNVDPLMHYLEEGIYEDRRPHSNFDVEFYLNQCKSHGYKPENPLLHYLMIGIGLGFKTIGEDGAPEEPAMDVPPVSPPTPAPEPTIFTRPPMQLYIDGIEVSPHGVLQVEGWVVCLAPIASVEVLFDDASLGAAEFGRPRPDVEEAHRDYPNARASGLLFIGDVGRFGPGPKIVTVRATAQTGIVREVTREIEVAELRERLSVDEEGVNYHCDRVLLSMTGRLSLSGWAVGPSPTTAIEVLLDGVKVGEAEIGGERGDVGNLFPSLPHARMAGFAANHQTKRSLSGEHLVTLRVRQNTGRVEEIELPVPAVEHDVEPELPELSPTGARGTRELRIDTPVLIDGAMEAPVRGNLEISGWALARAGVAAIDIIVDDVALMTADYGVRRLDVQAAFPDWDDARDSGFATLVPHRMLSRGAHKASVVLRDKAGGTTTIDFRMVVEPLPDNSGPWALRRKMPAADLELGRRLLAHQQWRPSFQVLMSIGPGTTAADVRATIASLKAQVYPVWRLWLDREPADPDTAGLAAEIAAFGDKCRIVSSFTAEMLPAEPAFFTALAPGGELGCDALHEMALASAADRNAEFFYSDERRFNPGSGEVEAFFKPQWSPDLLLSTNYIGQFWCARGDLVRKMVATDDDLLTQAPYDLVLRLTEKASAVRHVPAVLCEQATNETADREDDRAAVERALSRRGTAAEVLPGLVPGTWRIKRKLEVDGLVSIIIPTRATQGLIKRCIETIRGRSAYRNFEIVCIENIPPAEAHWRDWLQTMADRVVSTQEPFNWSRFNNQAAAAARGEFLLFLNDDIEIIDPDWLTVLLEQAQRSEVGVVGPTLLYPDRRIQHAGMFLAALPQARHAFRYVAEDEPGYFGLARTERNVMAVTGACLMTRRETFDRLGGFDESHDIVNNDLDYCLRVWEAGLRTVYTPHTRLIHYEAVSRADMADDFDAAAFDNKWRDLFLRGDPFFSPYLSKTQDAVAPDGEPNRAVVTGRPAMLRSEIKNILALKLDHIGDCIIAFPAVRRLKQHFPDSRITVLTSRASRTVWAMEPAVTQTIEFDFFHARSALGQVELSEDDWQALAERLRPEQFDLAIDLRKHLETRAVLQHTGARYLAGVDYRNKFPWLDVSIEWTGDQAFAHKRQHAAEDLVNLVDAVAASCEIDRQLITWPPGDPSAALGAFLDGLTGRRLVCIHPTAGNDLKQWPIEFFAAVADRLVEDNGVAIVLIGGPGDEAVGAQLLHRMRRADAAISAIGKFPLSDLPALLVRCSLFLGNDSGPKHIAAGLGVPTVAVHSGTVDVYEWGPIGPQAIAVARDMTCAPCYLPKPEDCRRGLACLRQLAPEAVYRACEKLLLAAVQA